MPDTSNAITLRFNGQRFGHWYAVNTRQSVDDLCAAVQLSVVRPGTGAGAASKLGIDANTVIELLMDEQTITTLRADSLRRRVGDKHHGIAVVARSLGRELVDCQWSKTLSGLKLGEIVKRLCAAFDVPVKIDADTAVVPKFSMQCEAPANALLNAVRAANLLLYPLPSGGLILTEPTAAAPVATLEYGVNIAEYEVIDEFKLRYSEYVIKGYDYMSHNSRVGKVRDEGISFFRPLHLVADRHGQDLGACDRRAQLERNRRLARAHSVVLTVPAWRYKDAQGQPQPWALNTQVRVIIPEEEIDDVFLIGDLELRYDAKGGDQSGDIALLTVMRREAFLGEQGKKKTKHGTGTKATKGQRHLGAKGVSR